MTACFALVTRLVTPVVTPLVTRSVTPLVTLSLWQTPKLGLLQIFIFIGFMEVIGILNTRRADYEPGNFLGSSQWETGETWENYQLKELNNGRLAMLACIGLWAQELVQGGQPVMFTLLERIATYEIPALFQEFHQ